MGRESADETAKIAEAMELGNQIAIHFGLKAALNYVGAVGFGSGREFDKAGRAQSIAGRKEVQPYPYDPYYPYGR